MEVTPRDLPASGTCIGVPGKTFFILDIIMHTDYDSLAAALMYKWTLKALSADISNSISRCCGDSS